MQYGGSDCIINTVLNVNVITFTDNHTEFLYLVLTTQSDAPNASIKNDDEEHVI